MTDSLELEWFWEKTRGRDSLQQQRQRYEIAAVVPSHHIIQHYLETYGPYFFSSVFYSTVFLFYCILCCNLKSFTSCS